MSNVSAYACRIPTKVWCLTESLKIPIIQTDDSITEHPLSKLAEEDSADKLDERASKFIEAKRDERLQKILNVFTTRTLDLELRHSQRLAKVLSKLSKADEEGRSLKKKI